MRFDLNATDVNFNKWDTTRDFKVKMILVVNDFDAE